MKFGLYEKRFRQVVSRPLAIYKNGMQSPRVGVIPPNSTLGTRSKERSCAWWPEPVRKRLHRGPDSAPDRRLFCV